MPPRAAVFATIACLASVALAGCMQPLSVRTVVNPLPPATQLQLTGTELNLALLPSSDFPAGFVIDAQESSNSGSSLVTPSPTPSATAQDCTQRMNAAVFPQSSMTGVATELLVDLSIRHFSAYHQVQVGQFVFQFPAPSAASGYLEALRGVVASCPTQTSTAKGAKGTQKAVFTTAPPVAGHPAFLLVQSGTTNGVPFVTRTLFALDGADVCLLSETAVGVPVPARPSLAALIAKLIARVQVVM
jgi:hypothetical protein